MTFGKRLRELRKQKGMTQKELATGAEINFTYLSKIETGVMPPPRGKTIMALVKALGVDSDGVIVDELFGLAKKMPSDLSNKVTPEMIQMLRSYEGKEDKPEGPPKTVKEEDAMRSN